MLFRPRMPVVDDGRCGTRGRGARRSSCSRGSSPSRRRGTRARRRPAPALRSHDDVEPSSRTTRSPTTALPRVRPELDHAMRQDDDQEQHEVEAAVRDRAEVGELERLIADHEPGGREAAPRTRAARRTRARRRSIAATTRDTNPARVPCSARARSRSVMTGARSSSCRGVRRNRMRSTTRALQASSAMPCSRSASTASEPDATRSTRGSRRRDRCGRRPPRRRPGRRCRPRGSAARGARSRAARRRSRSSAARSAGTSADASARLRACSRRAISFQCQSTSSTGRSARCDGLGRADRPRHARRALRGRGADRAHPPLHEDARGRRARPGGGRRCWAAWAARRARSWCGPGWRRARGGRARARRARR